jgi:hypothetical protein
VSDNKIHWVFIILIETLECCNSFLHAYRRTKIVGVTANEINKLINTMMASSGRGDTAPAASADAGHSLSLRSVFDETQALFIALESSDLASSDPKYQVDGRPESGENAYM